MRPRILVVDDDPDSRAVMVAALRDPGWDLVEASDIDGAMTALSTGPVEVILLDRHLAEVDGIDFVTSLSRDPYTSTIPVILISGLADEASRLAGLRAGALDFLDRSIGADELKAKVVAHTRYGSRVRQMTAANRADADEADDGSSGFMADLLRGEGGLRIHPVFQPVIDLASGRPVGFEGLSRFSDGEPPEPRFRAAERAGSRVDLELLAVTTQVAAAVDLPAGAWVALNVSPATLHDPRLSQTLSVATRDIVLELTEHDPVEDYAATRLALAQLPRQPGLAVDDAGSGYASLAHVLALRPRYVKLDRSWVHGVDTDHARRALIDGVNGFATEMGARVIAEGVETAMELRTLTDMGVALAQGFHLGRPSRDGGVARVIHID